jgi:methionine-rich copper-binding protein CopC
MRRLLLAAVALVAVLAPGSPAWAHTSLVSADPPRNATLTRAPAAVRLAFSQRLNPDFTTIVVTDAAKQRIPAGAPVVETVQGTVTFTRPLGNGAYTVAYRVVSADGHTVQGSYPFTVADPTLPAAAAAGPSAAGAAPPADTGGIPAGLVITLVAVGVVLAASAAYLYVSGRRRAAVRP